MRRIKVPPGWATSSDGVRLAMSLMVTVPIWLANSHLFRPKSLPYVHLRVQKENGEVPRPYLNVVPRCPQIDGVLVCADDSIGEADDQLDQSVSVDVVQQEDLGVGWNALDVARLDGSRLRVRSQRFGGLGGGLGVADAGRKVENVTPTLAVDDHQRIVTLRGKPNQFNEIDSNGSMKLLIRLKFPNKKASYFC